MEAPAMLLMKRIPRSRLDLLVPSLNKKIIERQVKQKKYFDQKAREKSFQEQEEVWVRDYRGTTKWVPGIIVKKTGPVSYRVKVREMVWRRHAEQLRPRNKESYPATVTSDPTEIELIPGEPKHTEPPTNIVRRPTRISRPPQRLIYYKPGDSVMYHN